MKSIQSPAAADELGQAVLQSKLCHPDRFLFLRAHFVECLRVGAKDLSGGVQHEDGIEPLKAFGLEHSVILGVGDFEGPGGFTQELH